jgi:transcriptional regulator with XRE-family HTH domain
VPSLAGSSALARRVGARVRAVRVATGITQEALAWEAGVSKGYVSLVEAGKRIPSLPMLVKIAKRLGVTLSQLLEGV